MVDKTTVATASKRCMCQGDGYIAELSGDVKSRIASHRVRLNLRELDGRSGFEKCQYRKSPHSITSSAKADNDGGIVSCNTLAVRMLIRKDR